MISLTAFNMIKAGAETNTRVFTPQKIVKEMLDALPPEVWNSKTTFLDPAVKSGVYLVEIYNRLMETPELIKDFPDEQDRAIHIYKNQLFGIAIDNFCCLMAQRNLYGHIGGESNIRFIDGYINLVKNKDPQVYKKAVEKEFKEVKFDVVIGNPPYQEGTGGGTNTEVAMPIYNTFVKKAIQVSSQFVSMIIPSRWMSGGKSVLDDFRRFMIESNHVTKIYHYPKSIDVFEPRKIQIGNRECTEMADIAGGVMYFLFDKKVTQKIVEFHNKYNLSDNEIDNVSKRDISLYTYLDARDNVQYMIMVDNNAESIIQKILSLNEERMDKIVLQYRPFGIGSDFEDSVIPYEKKTVKVVCSNGRETYTDKENITSNAHIINKYKICVGKVTGYADSKQRKNPTHPIINRPFMINPNEVCSMTYLVLGYFNEKQNAENMLSYIKTKFARYLMSTTISGMNMTARNYMFVPIQDFTSNSDIDWAQSISDIDKQLYKKYNLTDEEIDYIEKTIKPMI